MKNIKCKLSFLSLCLGMLITGTAFASDYSVSDLILQETESGYMADFFLEKTARECDV